MRVSVPGRGGSLVLRDFEEHDEAAARAAHEEMRSDGFDFLLGPDPDRTSWTEWIETVRANGRGELIPEGWVPARFLAAEADGELVGRVSIRLDLNDVLRRVGGHIGYGVRPRFRRQGHATTMLRGGLEILRRERRIEEAVVTCDAGNAASETVIRRAGGVLAPVAEGDGKLRFLVPVPSLPI